MRPKLRWLKLLAVALGTVVSLCGITAGSASAAACVKVVNMSEGIYKTRNASAGKCEEKTGPPDPYTEVEGLAKHIPGEPSDVLCIKVAIGITTSLWEDPECTKDASGGGYVKVLVRCMKPLPFTGQGSSLQAMAQQSVWGPGSNCGVNYESTSGGAGKKAWGTEEGTHMPGEEKTPSTSGDTFIGSDEPFTAGQITNLDLAAGGSEQTLVIPVLQAAVAVVVHPPSGCTPTEITNKSLLEVWNGTVKKWSSMKPQPAGGASCEKAITRVVQQAGSGTTFVFKTYLREIEEATLVAPCNKSWKEMAEPANNQIWSESGKEGCAAGLTVVKSAAAGDSGEAAEVEAVEGAIGYANLGDARAHFITKELEWLKVQHNGVKELSPTPTYANPGTAATEPGSTSANANCAETKYGKLPAATANDNLSELNGAHTSATNYSICTLSYDIALMNYETLGGFGAGSEATLGVDTKEYIEYVTGSETGEGQEAIASNHDYSRLPETPENIVHFSHLLALLVN